MACRRRSDNTVHALTGRGVPDIAANADPVTGYEVLVDGQRFTIGGTSAVAPLLAGLVAILNQQLGKPIGFWNTALYSELNTKALRDIAGGNNGTYAAAKGWDACTGVGVPVGVAPGMTSRPRSSSPPPEGSSCATSIK